MFPFFSMVSSNQLKKYDYFKILEVLHIKEDLVINSNAKNAIRKRTKKNANQKNKKNCQQESSTKKPAKNLQRNPQTPEVVLNFQKKTELSKRRKTRSLPTNDKKLLELNYTKDFRSVRKRKSATKNTKMKPSRVNFFLEGKKA